MSTFLDFKGSRINIISVFICYCTFIPLALDIKAELLRIGYVDVSCYLEHFDQ
jgi:hypothetical protein